MAFKQEIWTQDIISSPVPYTIVHELFSNKSQGGLTIGDAVHIPVVSYAAATEPGVGGLVSYDTSSLDDVTVNIDTERNYAFTVKNVEQAQTNVDIRAAKTAGAASSLNFAIDVSFCEMASTFTQSVGTFGTALTKEVILAAKVKLDKKNAPMMGRKLVVSPTAHGELLLIPEFTDVSKYGPNVAVAAGELGQIFGFKVFMSNAVKIVVGATTDTYNFAGVTEGLATAKSIANNVIAALDPDYKRWKIVADTLYGVKVLVDDFVVLVKS